MDTVYWDEDNVAKRLLHALNTAEQVIRRLAASGYTDAGDVSVSVQPEKVISETAFLLFAASAAVYIPAVNTRIQYIAQQLIPHARSKRMLLGVCLEPSLALDYAQAHVCLTQLGYPDECFDTLLRQSVSSQAFLGRERPPHRMLEQQWIMKLRDPSIKYDQSVVKKSVLNLPMDLLGGSREDIYAFTHALMYVPGAMHPWRLPRPRATILAEAEAALARCLDEQDYDLGGEVLLAWPLTGKSWSPAATFGFRVLAGVEDIAGFLPSPATRMERLNSLRGDERSDYLLASAYHTAYVMGLLSAASLRPGRLPPHNIPARATQKGAASPILKIVDEGSRSSHWRNELERLSDRERDAIAGLLLAIALRRKTREREFDTVRKLLEVGSKLGLADTPIASQAAEMLERLATFATCGSNELVV